MTYSITVSQTRINPVSEFKSRLKFTKNRFQFSVGLNLANQFKNMISEPWTVNVPTDTISEP